MPKLEVQLNEKKALVLEMEKVLRLATRRAEFSELWNLWVQSKSGEWNEEERALNPKLSDIHELPSVSFLLSENEAFTPVTKERFNAKMDCILAERAEFMIKIKNDLARMVTHPSANDLTVDLGILDHAISLFPCSHSSICNQLLPYPAILLHEHYLQMECRWDYFKPKIQPDPNLRSTIEKVLDILCIPKDGPSAAIEELHGRCVCLCGRHLYVDFGTLVILIVVARDEFRAVDYPFLGSPSCSGEHLVR